MILEVYKRNGLCYLINTYQINTYMKNKYINNKVDTLITLNIIINNTN